MTVVRVGNTHGRRQRFQNKLQAENLKVARKYWDMKPVTSNRTVCHLM